MTLLVSGRRSPPPSAMCHCRKTPSEDHADVVNHLGSLAQDNDRNKKIIVEEGWIPPLLKLLKESSSPEAQVAAATALCNLANDQDKVRAIVILGDSPIRVQTIAASLVSRMAENNEVAQEDFARENAN